MTDLPVSYGRNNLVLLPVEPYLIHAYWDLASTIPPGAGARPILRFHESPGRPFDVNIDLTTGSCYVNLWSPGKVYHAELGWRSDAGSFIPLAQSNAVQTPPSHPQVGHAAIAASVAEPVPEPVPEHLQQRVAELCATPLELEHEIPEPWGGPSFFVVCPPAQQALEYPDLTQLSEEHFTPGISSLRDPLGE